jgi:signal peptidase I
MRRYLPLLACAVLVPVVAVIRRRILLVTVHGSSMAPVYEDGDTLLTVRLLRSHAWQAGDDLVFARTSQQLAVRGDPPYLVKRVTAVAGDPMPADAAGSGPVPPGWLVVRGMNSTFYQVPADAIAGKVVRRLRRADHQPATRRSRKLPPSQISTPPVRVTASPSGPLSSAPVASPPSPENPADAPPAIV